MDGNKKLTGIVIAGLITLAITACKVQQPGYVSLYVDNLTAVNDTTDPGEEQLNKEDSAISPVAKTMSAIDAELTDPLRPSEQISRISYDSAFQHEVERKLNALNDSVQILRYQMIELQRQLTVMPDSIHAGEKPHRSLPSDSLQPEFELMQLNQENKDTITMLRDRVTTLNKAAGLTADTVYISEESVSQPGGDSLQKDFENTQLLQAINDSIAFLRKQLNKLQTNSNPKTDTVYIEKEAAESQPVKEQIPEQKTPDLFQALQDTVQQLKTRVVSLEEKTLPDKDTVLTRHDENDTPYKVKTDTIMIVASYERGGIKPSEEQSVLKQIKELCSNKNVTGITLSGYTDSSGSAVINKEITNRRLNYLSDMITPWIVKEKIFFQNFGDAFASDTIVSEERRIEITIVTL